MKKLLCLISGGFDSPVAAYRMAQSGYHVDYLFFYSLPFVRERDRDVVFECIKILNTKAKQKSRLFIVNNEKLLSKLNENLDKSLHVIMRRLMLAIAEKLAKKHSYCGIITGDSIGQVSSQTLSNLYAISRAVKIPIFRPLLGFDKEETISISRSIGTYDFSKLHKDCGLGGISTASTKASENELKRAEREIGAKKLINEAIQNLQVVEF